MPDANGHCPYCQSVGFENEAVERPGLGWVNQCGRCRRFSLYDEEDGVQYPLQNADVPDSPVAQRRKK